MSDCFFCGDFVGDENGDGGLKGRTVGNKDICEQCLGELKHWLNGTIPRSPSMREKKLVDPDDEVEESVSGDSNSDEVIIDEELVEEDDGDPFSSGAKI
ncbi:MAG: hypothetical protein WCI04_01935 [archaeon]